MAVTIKSKGLTIIRLVERLFDPEVVKGGLHTKAIELQTAGYKLLTNITDFSIYDAKGELFSVNMKLEAVKLAMGGKLGFVANMAIKDQVYVLIDGAYTAMPVQVKDIVKWCQYRAEVMDTYKEQGTPNKVAAIKKLRTLCDCSLKEAKDKVENWIDYISSKEAPTGSGGIKSGDEITVMSSSSGTGKSTSEHNPVYQINGTPVLLADADKLHQPIKGTNEGSLYHVIALGDTMNVAVRIMEDHYVAIRVHPKDNLVNLTSTGFKKSAQGHWSIHLHPDSREMAIKSVGAMLFTIGGPFNAVSGNINALIGIGK